MKKKQTFFLRDVKIRSEQTEDGKKYIVGTIPYNSEGTNITGMYREVITNTAFNQSLNSKRRIVALRNHNDDFPLGNTESGTLVLTSTEKGLECRCELPDTSYAQDLIVSVNRGDCTGMSFGFLPVKEDVKDNVCYLREVKLYEVSFGVVFPFYPEASAAVDTRNAVFETVKIRGGSMNEQVLQSLKTLVDDLQKVISSLESENADEKPEPAPEQDAAAEANSRTEQDNDENKEEEEKDEEKKKEEEEQRSAARRKKERARLLHKLDLISL